jgi:hypothetical protein
VGRKKAAAVDMVLSDMEWVLATLPDPLDVIDRCIDTVVVHWRDLKEGERRDMLALAHEHFVKALEANQNRTLVAA